MVKQNFDKLLTSGFIQPMEEVTWLSSIVIIPKQNGKFIICVDIRKLNSTTKKKTFSIIIPRRGMKHGGMV
jgi:hypothetical protein